MESNRLLALVRELEEGQLHPFSEWTPRLVPGGFPGVYTIWQEGRLLYVGISYREVARPATSKPSGLAGRLNSHASGRRSGDQFNMYICDRFVLPLLTTDQIQAVAEGRLSLDVLTRAYVRSHLGFRFAVAESGVEARAVERRLRAEGLPGAGKPLLNPL